MTDVDADAGLPRVSRKGATMELESIVKDVDRSTEGVKVAKSRRGINFGKFFGFQFAVRSR